MTLSLPDALADKAAGFGEISYGATRATLLLADPPYGEKNVNRRSTSFAQQLLDDPSLPKLIAPGGRLVLGHTKRDTLEVLPPWSEAKMLKHGDTVMRFLEIGTQEPA